MSLSSSRYLQAILLLSYLCLQSAFASPTLERIKQTNTIKIGYSHNVIPFNYLDSVTQKPVGYGIDISLEIVESLKKSLNLPDLKVEYVSTPFDERWKMHANGEVDLHCSTSTNTIERQSLADFSYTYFVANTRVMVKKSSGIKKYPDLAGKDVAIIAGTVSGEFFKTKKNYYHIHSFKVITSITQALEDAFAALKADEVAAIVYEDSLLLSMLLQNAKERDSYEILGKPIATEYYACTMQHGDNVFKELVNSTLSQMIQNKRLYQIYDKWFTTPLQSIEVNPDMPMSEQLEKLLLAPSDKAVGQM
ncbi:MAG: amino acid ABC transporter substrate-binding protein [Cardiobacteriaceae bacterium]|nr:amino acid ABC transporter substrate-binding protein [Cardiobacteriaceae bacterium]